MGGLSSGALRAGSVGDNRGAARTTSFLSVQRPASCGFCRLAFTPVFVSDASHDVGEHQPVRMTGTPDVLRVLLVEDSEADAVLIVHALCAEGRLVRSERVETPEAFTAALRGGPWDVIVCDHRMPRFSALEALRVLQASGEDIPFLIVSGAISEHDAVAAMKAGAHDYLMKDSLARLGPAVERECGEAAQRAARRRADAALRRSEAELRAVMAHVPDGLLTVSPSGALLSMNPAAEHIFGVRAEQVIGRPAEDFLPPGFASSVGQGSLECEARRSDGSLLQLEVSVAEVPDSVPSLVVTARDVTDRRRLEAEVQRTQKMDTVGMLAGGVAHDFNNVLTGIQSAAAMARIELPRNHAADGDLAEIERQCQRAAALVRQLLAFARKQPLARRTLNVNEVVLDVESLLRRVIGENVRFGVELLPDVWAISGDSAQLEQVLMNLCINARDAMPGGGRLTVRTANLTAGSELAARARTIPEKRYVVLSVADTGTGIQPRTLERIFEPFFTTKAPGRGTGLGLAVVHGIVRQHEGVIEVASSPGTGSTFSVLLPAVEADAVPAPVGIGAAAQQGSGTLLVVEDEASVRQAMVRMLEHSGYRVIAAADGEAALAALEQSEVDLVLLDAVLPGMPALDVYRRLQARWPATRVLLVSGYSEAMLDATLRRELSGRFLQKPFSLEELAERVRVALAPVGALAGAG
jgi:two-component system cell cycle sensor histidine kinase/response regulator CckA